MISLKRRRQGELRVFGRTKVLNCDISRFASKLAEDHAAVLNPDVDSAFTDTLDVVKRLLPYHIYLNPKEDLDTIILDRKGKSKADELRNENQGQTPSARSLNYNSIFI
jgi:hypothetical protein